jgi:hypothetical protein
VLDRDTDCKAVAKFYQKEKIGPTKISCGLWPDGTEAPIFVQGVIYRLYKQIVGKIWAVFAGGKKIMTVVIDKV